MLENNYLNKDVVVEEKLYAYSSTVSQMGMAKMAIASQNQVEGKLTAIDDDFIELDNKMLIARQFIYRISLKESND